MQLIGMFDSPFVRRVAITMRMLGIDFEHNPLSIFGGYKDFRKINPLVKVPTLICDDGIMLVDSILIIGYLESIAGRSLMPDDPDDHRQALAQIGTALVAMEKVAQRVYELKIRPEEYQYERWITRLNQQLAAALDSLEETVSGIDDDAWLFGDRMTQADISIAIAWRFTVFSSPSEAHPESHPALVRFSERAEVIPEFVACDFG